MQSRPIENREISCSKFTHILPPFHRILMKMLEIARSVSEMILESGDSVYIAKNSITTSINIHCIEVHVGVNKKYKKIA